MVLSILSTAMLTLNFVWLFHRALLVTVNFFSNATNLALSSAWIIWLTVVFTNAWDRRIVLEMLIYHSNLILSDCRISQTERTGGSVLSLYRFVSHSMTTPTKWHVRPSKTQISLGIRQIWSGFFLCAQWVANDLRFLHANSEYSDPTGRMPRLIWIFFGRIVHLVCFVVRRWFMDYFIPVVLQRSRIVHFS